MQAAQIILRKSVLRRVWVYLLLEEAKLCLGCLVILNVRGICTDFRATQLIYLPPLGFLSCTVLIAPALLLQLPQVFFFSPVL